MAARTLFLLLAVAILIKTHFLVARPWFLSWGATAHEAQATLPGDELVPNARAQTTRAISIAAPAERVYAWLAQTGQDRGGFYSYDLLEDLVGCEMPRIERLVPALQDWKLGDKLWMYPAEKLSGVGGIRLRAFERGRVLGFTTRQIGTSLSEPEDGSWTFVVEPIDAAHTRLIARGRGEGVERFVPALISTLVFEPVHFVMERRMLVGIKALAEGRHISALADALQVALWTVAFAAFIASGVLVLRNLQPLRRWVAFLMAGALFEALTLLQPPVWLGAALVALLLAAIALPRARVRRPFGGAPSALPDHESAAQPSL